MRGDAIIRKKMKQSKITNEQPHCRREAQRNQLAENLAFLIIRAHRYHQHLEIEERDDTSGIAALVK